LSLTSGGGTLNAFDGDRLIKSQLQEIENAAKGGRFVIVRRVAWTLGGLQNPGLLQHIITTIENTPTFNGEEREFIKTAIDRFKAGTLKPII
jgi:hypothetical protein